MKIKIRQLAILISISLISTIGLQIYYAIEVYKQKSNVFQTEVNQAFQKAVEKTNEQRLRGINKLFEQDISDTTQVKLDYEQSEDGPRLVVIDPKTGYKHLSMGIDSTRYSLPTKAEFIQIAVEKNWELLRNENILYWTQDIGNKLKAYSDSISISKDTLRTNMRAELLKFDIKEDFIFLKTDSSYSYDSTDQSFKIKMLPVKLDGETLLTAEISNPEITVLKRSTIVFILTLFALTLLFLSFYNLFKILKRQRKISVLKDDFIDNVTHELITPTATLQLALETLEKSSLGASNKYINIAKQHADRIEAIVDNVLKTSLNNSKDDKLTFELINIKNLLQDIINYYTETYGDQLKIIADFECELYIKSNKEDLSTVLHNVISNAIKYGNPTKPIIRVALENKEESIVILVSDNGMGIPKEHQKDIFDKFHRVPSKTHDVKGLGIGLYHARMIMQKLEGNLTLKSSTSVGSCFSIELKK